MRRRLSGLWIVTSRPPGDEEFECSAADICIPNSCNF
jgi:hypothetical protein